MKEEEQWIEADYYEHFRCKEGACRNSCCEGWPIAVSMKDYFSIIGMDCSPELHHKLECAFRIPEQPSPERYRLISPNYLGRCPLHDENGLCMVHRDLGEKALPEICRVYPRSLRAVGEERRACCSNSCEAVIETLMSSQPLKFFQASLDARPEFAQQISLDEAKVDENCICLLQREDLSLRESMREICRVLSGQDFYSEDALSGLRQLMEALRVEIKGSSSLQRFGKAALDRYGLGDSSDLERCYLDLKKMRSVFPHWEQWLENILANHFFYENMPWVDVRLKKEDVCYGLCLMYAALRVLGAAYLLPSPTFDNFADVMSGIFRAVEHGPFYYNARVLVKEPKHLLAL